LLLLLCVRKALWLGWNRVVQIQQAQHGPDVSCHCRCCCVLSLIWRLLEGLVLLLQRCLVLSLQTDKPAR
jgi:hypothetical protein